MAKQSSKVGTHEGSAGEVAMLAAAAPEHQFKPWPRPKPAIVLVLERSAAPELRLAAISDMLDIVRAHRPASFTDRVQTAVVACAGTVGFTTTSARTPPLSGEEAAPFLQWAERLAEGRRNLPARYTPPVSERSSIDRHPYEASPTKLTFGEFAAGVGCFAATAEAVGMTPRWIAEHNHKARRIALRNCHTKPAAFGSIFDHDPADLPWVHVLLGGTCCQPLSAIGKQLGWRGDRAYTSLRFLHNLAAIRPWVAVSENVQAQQTVHNGEVWELIEGTARALGYHTQAVRVCPSR